MAKWKTSSGGQFNRVVMPFDNNITDKAAIRLKDNIVELMQYSNPSGKSYRIGDRVHIASAPGQPPAPFTGNLIDSVDINAINKDNYQVSVGAPYGKYLEYGTTSIRPRPFVKPSIKKTIEQLKSLK